MLLYIIIIHNLMNLSRILIIYKVAFMIENKKNLYIFLNIIKTYCVLSSYENNLDLVKQC